jgi:hypothetical protein
MSRKPRSTISCHHTRFPPSCKWANGHVPNPTSSHPDVFLSVLLPMTLTPCTPYQSHPPSMTLNVCRISIWIDVTRARIAPILRLHMAGHKTGCCCAAFPSICRHGCGMAQIEALVGAHKSVPIPLQGKSHNPNRPSHIYGDRKSYTGCFERTIYKRPGFEYNIASEGISRIMT